ncbi:cytochrome-c peroxidase [Maritimibacter sp. HL-12]|jgi:cytochrome c peroxidase|uniref:cytochrome-c peroxidase n=1 Tax=Maritimibacter sp. HL-12 TaxID=1162418 RepID=UPI000A0F1421|nr:cytochrome c peroxidase [Maritimibacter sp. HL-12]SMH36071.1 Cytochrome c peroxidase [Maritimibacter sp. HL-12]
MKNTLFLAASALLPLAAMAEPMRLDALGEALFFDVNLSWNRTQSCATCHDPAFGFTDPRETELGRMVSLGDDGESLGDRNTPTAAYAMFSPRFEKLDPGVYRGGQFLDGREADLEGQAGGPPLNPIEMGMPDKQSVVARLAENPDYVEAFSAHFGRDVWDDTDAAYRAMTEAIAAFERTDLFAPFDSKYDRFLRGEVDLTPEEELGRILFFSEQFTNCNLCHQLRPSLIAPDETFSNYEYHNIGVPVNDRVRSMTGFDGIDHGLLANPAVDEPETDGQFRVPTLRNVAVTGPYMHNGVFEDLRTVVLFYNMFNTRDPERLINPETGAPFRDPEVPGTLSMDELTHGPALDDRRVDALVAFMETLTDARYEHLLDD